MELAVSSEGSSRDAGPRGNVVGALEERDDAAGFVARGGDAEAPDQAPRDVSTDRARVEPRGDELAKRRGVEQRFASARSDEPPEPQVDEPVSRCFRERRKIRAKHALRFEGGPQIGQVTRRLAEVVGARGEEGCVDAPGRRPREHGEGQSPRAADLGQGKQGAGLVRASCSASGQYESSRALHVRRRKDGRLNECTQRATRACLRKDCRSKVVFAEPASQGRAILRRHIPCRLSRR